MEDIKKRLKSREFSELIRNLQEWYKERYSITKLTGRHLHEQYSFNNLYG